VGLKTRNSQAKAAAKACATTFLLLLAGCSRTKAIDREQAQSELRQASSLAAESELFTDFVRQGKATRRYAEGHAAMLGDEIAQSAKELDEASPEPGAQDSVRESRSFLAAARANLDKANGRP
jgi:hypothetical protein